MSFAWDWLPNPAHPHTSIINKFTLSTTQKQDIQHKNKTCWFCTFSKLLIFLIQIMDTHHKEDVFCKLFVDANKEHHCVYSSTSLVEDYDVADDVHAMTHGSVRHLKTL